MSTAAVITPDVPEAKKVAICEHIKDNGLRCGSPALRARHFCYNHARAHTPSRLGTRYYRAPIPESIESLQLTLLHITEALGAGVITDKVAGKLLYAVQLSTNLLKMKRADVAQPFLAVPSAAIAEGGEVAGATTSTDEVLTATSKPEPVTDLSPAMIQALTPRVVEPIDEPAPAPKPITRQQFHELLSHVMTDQQRAALLPTLGDGDVNPGFDRASRRIAAHYDALQCLADAGIHRDDPRLQPFFQPPQQSGGAS